MGEFPVKCPVCGELPPIKMRMTRHEVARTHPLLSRESFDFYVCEGRPGVAMVLRFETHEQAQAWAADARARIEAGNTVHVAFAGTVRVITPT